MLNFLNTIGTEMYNIARYYIMV